MSQPTNLKTGAETIAYCTSCKLNLNHVIIATHLTAIMKVQCLTCKKFHGYRPSKSPNATKKSPSSTVKNVKSEDTVVYEKLLQASSTPHAHPSYTPTHAYKAMDCIQHTQFGTGIVEKVLSPHKIQVLFISGSKHLVHNFRKT